MSRFVTELAMAKAGHNDDGQWVLIAPLVYESDIASRTITVPIGFRTDLASVPRLPLIYLLAGGTSDEAAVIHDYLYSTRELPRKTADAVLSEASKATRVPAWRRGMMWAAVRLFGGNRYSPRKS